MSSAAETLIREMQEADLAAVGVLAARLVRFHHAIDPKRFLELPDAANGYIRYFATQLAARESVLLVAVSAGTVVGYAYGRLEPRDYNALLDAHGALHDVLVDEASQRRGTGEALVREMVRRLGERGAPRVVLATATQNVAAQRLFTRIGFRSTMIEMTRET